MATALDLEGLTPVAIENLWPAVVVLGRGAREGDERVQRRERLGEPLDAFDLVCDLSADLAEQFVLAFIRAFFRADDLILALFEFRRDEPLGVLEGLATLVVLGHRLEVRVRHLDVVAVNRVVADLQRVDSGPLAFALLEVVDPLFAVAGGPAQVVQIVVVPSAMMSPSVISIGGSETIASSISSRTPGQRIEGLVKPLQSLTIRVSESLANVGNDGEGIPQRAQVPRVRPLARDPSDQPLEIVDRPQPVVQPLARLDRAREFLHGVQPRLDPVGLEQRPPEPVPELSAAERAGGVVEHADQRRLVPPVNGAGFEQFETSQGDGVQQQVLPRIVPREVGEILEVCVVTLDTVRSSQIRPRSRRPLHRVRRRVCRRGRTPRRRAPHRKPESRRRSRAAHRGCGSTRRVFRPPARGRTRSRRTA